MSVQRSPFGRYRVQDLAQLLTLRNELMTVRCKIARLGAERVHRLGARDGFFVAGFLEQSVDIVDGEGNFWTAVYTLRQEPDGTWKITGCFIQKAPGLGA